MVAIDPTVKELRPGKSELAWLKKCAQERQSEVQAVHISLGNGSRSISYAEFSDYVFNLHLGKNINSTVIQEESSSRHKAIQSLILFLVLEQSDLVVVSSHGRSGPGRIVLGSFAESLLASSPVPVLFLSEDVDEANRSNKILFPTDFSETSKRTLALFLKHLEGFRGELVLYHAISIPASIFETGMMGIPIFVPDNYWSDQQAWAKREIEDLSINVRDAGFIVRTVIQDNVLNVASAIREFASNEQVTLIGMASARVDVETSLLGAVAKGIFRQRKWPVWVCGPGTKFKEDN